MKSWSWVLLIVSAILIKWVSLYPGFVERNYSEGLYPLVSSFQRILFGWIPISIGDLFYIFLILVLVFRTGRFFRLLFRKQLNRQYFASAMQQGIFFFLFVYVTFNLLWGLNYNRTGIAGKLGLEVKAYSQEDLLVLTDALHQRLNFYAEQVTEEERRKLNRKPELFHEGEKAFSYLAEEYPFLKYKHASVKPSIFSYAGNYLGFQGYYNPFSGEAQVNTTIPRALEPFVTTHEIAHQLGYARENEANFVAYLACRTFPSVAFRYSMYLDMFNYTLGELRKRDPALANMFYKSLHPQVINDIEESREFYTKYKNPVEPVIMWGYSHYLKANNQPAGKETYNEVVAWLIAYYKKFGTEKL